MNDQNYTPEVIDVTPAIPMQENGKPLKKRKYLFTAAPQKTRIVSFVALGLAALFSLLVVIGAISALTRPVWEVPIFSLAAGEKTTKEMENVYEEAYDVVKDAIREDDDATIDELEDRYDLPIKSIEKAIKNPSLLNVSKLAIGLDGMDTSGIAALGVIIFLIVGGAAIVLLFSILGTLLLNKALLIVGYVLGIPFFLLFAGSGIWVTATIALIAFIVVQSIVKKAYKSYKKSFAK